MAVIEQLHILCCDTPSCFIMSKAQMTSASSLSVNFSDVYGPSFLLS